MKRLGAKIYALLITVMKPNFTTLEHYLKMITIDWEVM